MDSGPVVKHVRHRLLFLDLWPDRFRNRVVQAAIAGVTMAQDGWLDHQLIRRRSIGQHRTSGSLV